MRRCLPALPALALAGATLAACAGAPYTRAEVVYAQPARYVYVEPVERVVVVTRETLIDRGYVVYRVEERGRNRVIWARHRDDEVVRVFVSPEAERVLVRGIREMRPERRRGRWSRRDDADEVLADVDVRLHGERH